VARTVVEPTTEADWKEHLAGTAGLGVVPIRDDNTCLWGAIDIDEYDFSHKKMADKLKKKNLPACMFRSKSGGAHIYFFFSESIAAGDLLDKLKEISASLGYAGVEVFPKQRQIHAENGDSGNWLNMPYYGPDSLRYAFDENGDSLSISEFLDYADGRTVSPDIFLAIDSKPVKSEKLIPNGPPCLQVLAAQGFGEGGRNNALFSLGVYLRMSKKDGWEREVEAYNAKYMKPPLPSKEVEAIIKGLEKKDYFYKCDDQPLASFCDKQTCMTRKYGVGPGLRNSEMSGLSKLESDPPRYFINIDGHRIELPLKALVNQKLFQEACIAQANIYPRTIREDQWANQINDLLSRVIILPTPVDVTRSGTFEEILFDYCYRHNKGADFEDALQSVPVWKNDNIYFRTQDIQIFINRMGMRRDRGEIHELLRLAGATNEQIRIGADRIQLWALPQVTFRKIEAKKDLPNLEEHGDVM